MSIYDDYVSAIKGGNTGQANYLAQMLAAQAGININTNQVTAAPLSMVQSNSSSGPLPQTPDFWDQFYNTLGALGKNFGNGLALDSYTGAPSNFKIDPTNGSITSGTGQAMQSAGSTLGSIGSLTLARIATILIGAMLIAAGLFGLTGAHNIVLQQIKP